MKKIKDKCEQKNYKSIAKNQSYFKDMFVQIHTVIFILFRNTGTLFTNTSITKYSTFVVILPLVFLPVQNPRLGTISNFPTVSMQSLTPVYCAAHSFTIPGMEIQF